MLDSLKYDIVIALNDSCESFDDLAPEEIEAAASEIATYYDKNVALYSACAQVLRSETADDVLRVYIAVQEHIATDNDLSEYRSLFTDEVWNQAQ